MLFGTTFTFLERFGLTSTEDLPPLSSDAAQLAALAEAPPMASERLQKLIARAGLASRRGAEQLIADGRVRVNGRLAGLGDSADPAHDRIEVDGRPLARRRRRRFTSPSTSRAASSARRATSVAADRSSSLVDAEGQRLWPAGRLDVESEGLMILTNDGEWANRVLHPRYGNEREYAALVDADHPRSALARLRSGVTLEDGPAQLLSARHAPPPREVARSADARRGEWLRVRIGEGRKREVRRLFEAVGSEVERLVRIRIGTPHPGRPARGRVAPPAAQRGGRAVGIASAVTRTIAIDGPSGAGKSTIGFALADRIDATFVDTGLMYRALTLAALERGIDVDDGPALGDAGRSMPRSRSSGRAPTRPTGSRPFASTAAT